MVVSFSHQRSQTPTVKRTLNPAWDAKDATFDFPIYFSLVGALGVLELVVWDKDTFKKDYLGEVSLSLEDWFKDGVSASFEDPKNEVSTSTYEVTQRALTYFPPSLFGPQLFPQSHLRFLPGQSRLSWDLFVPRMSSNLPTMTVFTPSF